MTESDRGKFAAMLTGTADYYRTKLSKFTIEIYWKGLHRFDIDAIETAIQRHISRADKEAAFMPKVNDLTIMLEGRTGDQSAVAWSKVDHALRSVGTWEDVVFDDALIHRVIEEMGGWVWFGTKDERDWPFIAKEFQTRYQGYRMRSETPDYQPVLVGIANSQNGQSGVAIQPPVLVGNKALCQQVLLCGGGAPIIGITRNVTAGLNVKRLK
ncbi:DUF6475 domain-containing protein [Collimonas humicola]|uniref:DUF6475 domain-containing protein n=1 Tax=Collimonas humicola TaxID=2825886 RepID=UPI001B8B1CE0|nr:DUF6475 domain-containing protein [Collimonas humicola]